MRKILFNTFITCFALLVLACPALAQGSADPALHAGLQGQNLSDITITEPVAEAIQTGDLYLHLPQGIYWASRPDVAVTRGDLTLGAVSWDSSDQNLIIAVEDTSSTPSTITVSNITVTTSRHLPAGPVEIKVGGPAVNDTYGSGLFRAWTVSAFLNGRCITPAPDNARVVARFCLGQTACEVNGLRQSTGLASFVENGVIYLPFRTTAKALGVKESHVLWDSSSSTLTLIKDGRVVQANLKQQKLLINGVPINTPARPLVKDGHVMLPLDWVTPVFGADVDYDRANSTITIIGFK